MYIRMLLPDPDNSSLTAVAAAAAAAAAEALRILFLHFHEFRSFSFSCPFFFLASVFLLLVPCLCCFFLLSFSTLHLSTSFFLVLSSFPSFFNFVSTTFTRSTTSFFFISFSLALLTSTLFHFPLRLLSYALQLPFLYVHFAP